MAHSLHESMNSRLCPADEEDLFFLQSIPIQLLNSDEMDLTLGAHCNMSSVYNLEPIFFSLSLFLYFPYSDQGHAPEATFPALPEYVFPHSLLHREDWELNNFINFEYYCTLLKL